MSLFLWFARRVAFRSPAARLPNSCSVRSAFELILWKRMASFDAALVLPLTSYPGIAEDMTHPVEDLGRRHVLLA